MLSVFLLQTLLRLSYELNVHRQGALEKETMEALTARCDEQNEELTKLKEQLGELPGLKEKVAKCDELKSRLQKASEWREAASKALEGSIANLDKATTMSATLSHGVSELVDAYNKYSSQTQFLKKQVEEDVARFNKLLEAARVFKHRSERRARIARDLLKSYEPEAETFLDGLTAEMMEASALISFEQVRLAAAELGLDFDSIKEKADELKEEATANLKQQLEKESAVLIDADWDAKELEDWLAKVSAEAEKEALCLDLENLALFPSPLPEVQPNMAVSDLEGLSLDLSNLLVDEGKKLTDLKQSMPEAAAEPFDVEEYINFSPAHQGQSRPADDAEEAAAAADAVEDFLNDN